MHNLPSEIQQIIMGYLPMESWHLFCIICTDWENLRAPDNLDPNELLFYAVKNGHRTLCLLAKAWGATNFDWALCLAAEYGHGHICELAIKEGATQFNWMLIGATRGGHIKLCLCAKEHGADNFNSMLAEAGQEGNLELCRLAKAWGAWDYDVILSSTTNKELCDFAMEWYEEKYARPFETLKK